MSRLPLLLFAVCLLAAPAAARPEEALTPARAKELIPAAAGSPAEEFRKLTTSDDPNKFRPSNGDSLTWIIISYVPGRDAPKNPTSFRFLTETVNPSALANALIGPKDRDGEFRDYASLIHPEYITDCTCKVDGDTATGTVTFRADKVYEGKAEYTARKKDGKWRIEELRLPDLKIATGLGKDGKWEKK